LSIFPPVWFHAVSPRFHISPKGFIFFDYLSRAGRRRRRGMLFDGLSCLKRKKTYKGEKI
jgi:hypothetical protein